MCLVFNKTEIAGRITADPELRRTPQGKCVASGSLAVSRKLSQEGETDFFRFILWGDRAENFCNLVKKGTPLMLCGKMQNNPYEKDGKRFDSWELNVSEYYFTESKKNEGSNNTPSNSNAYNGGNNANYNNSNNGERQNNQSSYGNRNYGNRSSNGNNGNYGNRSSNGNNGNYNNGNYNNGNGNYQNGNNNYR